MEAVEGQLRMGLAAVWAMIESSWLLHRAGEWRVTPNYRETLSWDRVRVRATVKDSLQRHQREIRDLNAVIVCQIHAQTLSDLSKSGSVVWQKCRWYTDSMTGLSYLRDHRRGTTVSHSERHAIQPASISSLPISSLSNTCKKPISDINYCPLHPFSHFSCWSAIPTSRCIHLRLNKTYPFSPGRFIKQTQRHDWFPTASPLQQEQQRPRKAQGSQTRHDRHDRHDRHRLQPLLRRPGSPRSHHSATNRTALCQRQRSRPPLAQNQTTGEEGLLVGKLLR